MPWSEFLKHYEFWQQFKWGMTDDMLSIVSRINMHGSRIATNWEFKEFAVSGCGFVPPKVESPEDSWAAVDAYFQAMP